MKILLILKSKNSDNSFFIIITFFDKIIARGGFEPPSPGPEPHMIDLYTTGLFC